MDNHTSYLDKTTIAMYKALFILLFSTVLSQGLFGQYTELKHADKFFELSDYRKAIESYKKVIKNNPHDIKSRARIAECYYMTHDYKLAEYWSNQLSNYDNVSSGSLLLYGKILMTNQKYEAAKVQFRKYSAYNSSTGKHFIKSCDLAKNILAEKPKYTIEPSEVNSNHADFGPTFYKNKIIYATCGKQALKSSLSSDLSWNSSNQLYSANTTSAGKLQASKPLGGDYSFKQKLNEGPVSFAQNGRYVAYTKNNFTSGTRVIPNKGTTLKLYFANVDAKTGEWTNTKAFPHNSDNYNVGYPSLSPDGKTLYFSSNLDDAKGYDIYVSYNKNGTWSRPKNLGNTINTLGNEISPFLEEGTLYFSSDYHHGLGGYDIFQSTQVNGRWDNVNNLGKLVNSSYDDIDFIYDSYNNIGFLTSNRKGGKGFEDIYRVKYAAQKIKFVVKDEYTKEPIRGADIKFLSFGNSSFKTDGNGVYTFSCPLGITVDVSASKIGYSNEKVRFTSTGNNIKDKTVSIYLASTNRNIDEYNGLVINALTGKNVSNAIISVKDLSSGKITKTTSKDDGSFMIALNKNTSYEITVDKWSYENNTKKINTSSTYIATLINSISIKPASKNVPVSKATSANKKSNTNNYQVQIGAFSKPDWKKLNALEKYGTLSYDIRNNIKVYKMGPYMTQWSAEQAKKKAIEMGYNDAFIIAPTTLAAKPKITPVNTSTPKTPIFRVQLGAYSNTKWFEKEKAQSCGNLLSEKTAKGVTIFYLGDYTTQFAASEALKKAKIKGFSNAFVVEMKDGKKTNQKGF